MQSVDEGGGGAPLSVGNAARPETISVAVLSTAPRLVCDMALAIPAHPSAITARWLEDVLAAHRPTAPRVTIAALEVEPAIKWNQAETAFLKIRYARNAPDLPTRLFTKLRREPDPLSDIFPGEVRFYNDARDADLPIAPCLAAFADPATGATCVLLEDLRPTHVTVDWPLPPTVAQCRLALTSLARVHADGRQRAGSALGVREALLGRHVADMLPAFIDMLGDRLPKDRADRLVAACQATPDLKAAAYASGGPVTRVHGDAHFWNVLYPRPSTKADALLIEWEDWRIDLAGTDLALLMAVHWYPDRRARHEVDLLRHYLAHLNRTAVEPMTWDDLWHEYRLGLVCNAAIPVFQQAAGTPHASWWSHLERWFLAFEDLGCAELL
ncbi:MAG: hypothetical protein AAGE18_06675 [Pseudomonadota bacterium]